MTVGPGAGAPGLQEQGKAHAEGPLHLEKPPVCNPPTHPNLLQGLGLLEGRHVLMSTAICYQQTQPRWLCTQLLVTQMNKLRGKLRPTTLPVHPSPDLLTHL